MMIEIVFTLAAATLLGSGVAQLTGAVACDWRAQPGQMKTRLLILKRRALPGRLRRALGALLVGSLLAGGGLLAYAAEPSAPERLLQEVIGVVGSGDQLSLKVAQDQQIKTVRLNEEYRDGWMLKALSPAVATLVKDGETRQVGLNPSGAVAQDRPKRDPSKVDISGDTIEARQAKDDAYIQGYWTAFNVTDHGIKWEDLEAYLGDHYNDFLDNEERMTELMDIKARADAVARGDFNLVRYYDGLPVAGPDSFEVPRGMTQNQAAQAIGLTTSLGYAIDAVASGKDGRGTVMTKCNTPTTPTASLCKSNLDPNILRH